MSSRRWVSLHLHLGTGVYSDETDRFLVDFVRPRVLELTDRAHRIERFFYIRYGLKGPHLRLRFDGLGEGLDEAIDRHVVRPFHKSVSAEGWRDAYDRARTFTNFLTASALLAPGSVEAPPYLPELDRLGGERGAEIADQIFVENSAWTLQILSTLRPPSLEMKRAVAYEVVRAHIDAIPEAHRSPGFLMNYATALADAELGWSSNSLWETNADLRAFLLDDYSSRGPARRVRLLLDLLDRQVRTSCADVTAAEDAPGLADWRGRLAENIEEFARESERGRLAIDTSNTHFNRSSQVRTFTGIVMHLALNRLGVALVDEALICVALAAQRA